MNAPVSAMTKTFAAMILDAMRIRENSFDAKAAQVATEECDARKKAEPKVAAYLHVDYSTFYRKTQEEAAHEAANNAGEPKMGYVLYLLMANSWNDAYVWAENPLEFSETSGEGRAKHPVAHSGDEDEDDMEDGEIEIDSAYNGTLKQPKPSPMEKADPRDVRAANRALLAHHDALRAKK
jgi:hypothetical protein